MNATDFDRVKQIREIVKDLDEEAKFALLDSDEDLNDKYLKFTEVNPARRELGDDAARQMMRDQGAPARLIDF